MIGGCPYDVRQISYFIIITSIVIFSIFNDQNWQSKPIMLYSLFNVYYVEITVRVLERSNTVKPEKMGEHVEDSGF